MGLQAGTQVDPRLLDYSGYAQGMTQASAITGAMLANIGQEIAEKKEEKKQKKATISLMKDMIKNMPELAVLTGMDDMIDVTDADLTTAATKLYDTLGGDMSQKVTLLALSSLFEDAEGDKVDPSTFVKAKEALEDEGIVFSDSGPVRKIEKGSYGNLISRFLGGRALDIDLTNPFGRDQFVPVGEEDPSVEAIKGGPQVISSSEYNPIGAKD